MSALVTAIKQGVRAAAAFGGRQNWPSLRPQLVVLSYHRVLPATDARAVVEQPGMMVTPETFAMQLKVLRRKGFSFVHLDEWVAQRRAGGTLPRKACAITFDDGWRDNYEFAFPLLREAQVPATIFLVADMIGTERRFWPERVASLVAAARADGRLWSTPAFSWLRESHRPDLPLREAIDICITAAKRFDDSGLERRIVQAEAKLDAPVRRHASMLDWREVREMRDGGLVRFGSHTRRHARMLPNLNAQTMREEIAGSRAAIAQQVGQPVNLFCYPNGDMTAAAEGIVREHYAGACTVRRGWNGAQVDVHRLRRINMHEDMTASPSAFAARLSGWV